MESSLTWIDFYRKYYDAEKSLVEYFAPQSDFVSDSVVQSMARISNFFASDKRRTTTSTRGARVSTTAQGFCDDKTFSTQKLFGAKVERTSPGAARHPDGCQARRSEALRTHVSCEKGSLKGDILIVYGGVTNLHLLLSACDHFKEIILIDVLDTNLQYVKKWKNNDPQSFNWKDSFKIFQESEDREQWTEKEEMLKQSITLIEKVDVDENNREVLKIFPQADCLFSPYHLTKLCKDHASFISSVKNMSSLLKVGGHLIISVFIRCTYWYIETLKFPILYIDEDFARKVLKDEGFVIKEAVMNQRTNPTTFSSMDYSGILFIFAEKLENVP